MDTSKRSVARRARWTTFGPIVCAISTACGAVATAQDFRIETALYANDARAPVSKATTLFEQGVVYDFLSQPGQIAVYRPKSAEQPGRFVLLDADRKVRTELTTDRLEGLLAKVRSWAASQEEPLFRFQAKPRFEDSFDEETGQLILSSDLMTYRVVTEPGGNAAAMAAYREFCDAYARLNAVTQRGMLPFARLKLNAILDELGRVPTSVELTIPQQKLRLRAVHAFMWRLSKDDRRKIETVRAQLGNFRPVDNAEFRKVTELASNPQED
jgi:hypothetical protein